MEIFDDKELKHLNCFWKRVTNVVWGTLTLGDINSRMDHKETGELVDYSASSTLGFITQPSELITGRHNLYVSYTTQQ